MSRAVAAVIGTTVAVLAIFVSAAPGESNRVVASATGSGHMVRNGFYRTFSFSARTYSDGTSEGQLQLHSPELRRRRPPRDRLPPRHWQPRAHERHDHLHE